MTKQKKTPTKKASASKAPISPAPIYSPVDRPIVSGEPLMPSAVAAAPPASNSPPLAPVIGAQAIKTNVHITVTQGAAKKITMEEAEMLVKFAWPEIVKNGKHNSFALPKIGLAIVRDGEHLFIMTIEEKEAALKTG